MKNKTPLKNQTFNGIWQKNNLFKTPTWYFSEIKFNENQIKKKSSSSSRLHKKETFYVIWV